MPLEALKATAVQFLQLASAGRVEEAYASVAPDFRHHNPFFACNASALKAAMQDNALKNPDKIFEVQQTISEGQMVVVHSKVQMPSKAITVSVVHIFRFESGQIAELWDIGQPQPTDMPNELGMF
ncbi:nuclear transport factor 2 family protein [uncultured Aquabacterium sp.]|uniref:nuclear transport factor 2 family protein n=1 Tax=uncultured Aquabacterium sp. TaxID=158753 RepID=UPI0025E0569E|nr:nuclear transport factor 2 family protein [uncultured Aquabacterium sp.]